MECPGCNRRFGPAAVEQWDTCPICGTSWTAAPAMASGGSSSWASPSTEPAPPLASTWTPPAPPAPPGGPTQWTRLGDGPAESPPWSERAAEPPDEPTAWSTIVQSALAEPTTWKAPPTAEPTTWSTVVDSALAEPDAWSPPAPAEPTTWSTLSEPAAAEPPTWSPPAPPPPPPPAAPPTWSSAPPPPPPPSPPASGTPWLPTEAPEPSSWRARVATGDTGRRPASPPGTLVVAPRARIGFRFYDFAVYEDAVQLVPIAGPAPELVGAAVGFFTVSAYLGWFLGSLYANRSNPQRLADLRRARPTPRIVPGERSRPIAHDEIADAQLHRTLFSTRLRLRFRDGNKALVLWPNRQLRDVDLQGALAAGLGPTLRVKPITVARKVMDGIGAVMLAAFLVLITGGVVSGIVSPGSGDQPSSSPQQVVPTGPGYAQAQRACRELARYEQWMGVRQTTPEEDAAAADTFAAGMAAAARENPSFVSAAAAGRELAMLIRTPEQYGSDYEQQVNARVAVIGQACTRAG